MVRIEKIPAEVFNDFLSEKVGIKKVVGSFEAFVPEPKDIEAGFVTARLHILKNQNRASRRNAKNHFFLLTYCLTQNS